MFYIAGIGAGLTVLRFEIANFLNPQTVIKNLALLCNSILKKTMNDLSSKITRRGAVYLWKYKTDGWIGSEWHFSYDEAGKDFLRELFGVLEKSELECRFSIKINEVTQAVLDIPDFNSPFENRKELRLTYTPFDSHFNTWVIGDNENIIDIAFGKRILNDWRRLIFETMPEPDNNALGLHEDDTLFVWTGFSEKPTLR